ncbi:MAG: CRISPR-associated endonuclease Cas2 [Candidatus Aenigmatarchaeota archaeon]
MYVIIVYDVSIDKVSKVCQFLRQYLNWVQNSVFEGELTESELEKVKVGIENIINLNEDSVIIYQLSTHKILKKEHIGLKKAEPSSII